MNAASTAKGRIFRCPICGAEVSIIAPTVGEFDPHCCGVAMEEAPRRLVFYVCPICGAEVAVVNVSAGEFSPRCCATDMVLQAA